MADLSDDKLTTIIATVTGDQSDLSGDARFEAMRAAIAADRALNAAPPMPREMTADEHGIMRRALWNSVKVLDAAPSVGAEGLPSRDAVDAMTNVLLAAWSAAEPTHPITRNPVSYMTTFADMARAALASRPAVDAPADIDSRIRAIAADRDFWREQTLAADRALNASRPAVDADKRDAERDELRAAIYALAALASRPAVDADKRDAERDELRAAIYALRCEAAAAFEQSSSPGYKLHDFYRMKLDKLLSAARHPAQKDTP